PALEVMAPGDRVVGAHGAPGVGRFVERCQDVNGASGIRAEVVPLVSPLPVGGNPPGGRMRTIDYVDGGRLDHGVRLEVGAEQPAVEGPLVLGVGGRVDPDPPAAMSYVGAEGALLPGREHVAAGAQEDHCVEAAKALPREDPGVLGGADREAVCPAEAP